MTDEFSQNVLIKVVAQICQMVGFHKTMTSPINILADILQNFIRRLGQTAQHYAEHCGRSCLNLSDLSLAFYDSGVRPSDLSEFLEIVSPLPQTLPIPKYPVIKNDVCLPCDESQILQENKRNNNEENRESLKIKISLSKIKAACKTKRNKSMKNKKKKSKRQKI